MVAALSIGLAYARSGESCPAAAAIESRSPLPAAPMFLAATSQPIPQFPEAIKLSLWRQKSFLLLPALIKHRRADSPQALLTDLKIVRVCPVVTASALKAW